LASSTLLQGGFIKEVPHPDADPAGAVGVGGADAAAGGADEVLSRLDVLVVGEHQVGALGDLDLGVEAALFQGFELGLEGERVHHHAVGEDAFGVGVDHPGGQEVELEDLLAHHHRVAGVGAALKANHVVGLGDQRVGDLALALVAPLGA